MNGKLSFWYRLFNHHLREVSETQYAKLMEDQEAAAPEIIEDTIRSTLFMACPCSEAELQPVLDMEPLFGGGFFVKATATCPVCKKQISKEFRFMRGTMWMRSDDKLQWITMLDCPPFWKFWHYLPRLFN